MNGYEIYLENLLRIREKEIDTYRNFIESELKCKIQEEVMSNSRFNGRNVEEVRYKVITIPQSRYAIKLDD